MIFRNNMMAWEKDPSYFIPKELPTMNLFCKISWSSWYNARRVISMYYTIEKRFIDAAYTLIGLYGLFVIGVLVFDHYGTFWPKQ